MCSRTSSNSSLGAKSPLELLLAWTTPRTQIIYLLERANFVDWEAFRDSLIRRWTNLNVVCGLIMGAISTILFSNYSIGRIAFALGVVSLLSSLVSIGFGVGLIYVLGDVPGRRLHIIGTSHRRLFTFALAIPQTWAGVSFCAFFACTCMIFWEASDKGVPIKMGILAAAVTLVTHVAGFAYIFRDDGSGSPEQLIAPPTDLR